MYEVKVIRIDNIRQHENADRLEIIDVKRPGGQDSCIVQKGQFKLNDLAVFVEADYMVPTGHSLFSTFKKSPDEMDKMIKDDQFVRIKAKRLRGVWSNCLLVKALDGMVEGQNVIDELGIKRYDPDEGRPFWSNKTIGGDCAKAPSVLVPVYEVEAGKKYDHRFVFEPGEMIAVTEKIHGTNARYMFFDGEMFCGSHKTWEKESVETDKGTIVPIWWKILHQNEWLEGFCRAHEGLVVYGEVFGDVQNLKYGANSGELFFRIFDLYSTQWSKYFTNPFNAIKELMRDRYVDKAVPIIHEFKYYPETYDQIINGLVSGGTMINVDGKPVKQVREGIVVRSLENDWSIRSNMRKMLKYVSNEYLEL